MHHYRGQSCRQPRVLATRPCNHSVSINTGTAMYMHAKSPRRCTHQNHRNVQLEPGKHHVHCHSPSSWWSKRRVSSELVYNAEMRNLPSLSKCVASLRKVPTYFLLPINSIFSGFLGPVALLSCKIERREWEQGRWESNAEVYAR